MLEATMAVGDGTELTGHDGLLHDCGELPLLSPIDRWGYTPLHPVALTPQAVSAIVRAYLDGKPSLHVLPSRPLRQVGVVDEGAACDSVTQLPLDPGYYHHGIAARKKTHTALRDVQSILDGVELRADRLMDELLDLGESIES